MQAGSGSGNISARQSSLPVCSATEGSACITRMNHNGSHPYGAEIFACPRWLISKTAPAPASTGEINRPVSRLHVPHACIRESPVVDLVLPRGRSRPNADESVVDQAGHVAVQHHSQWVGEETPDCSLIQVFITCIHALLVVSAPCLECRHIDAA